ncbi:MAG: ATP-binding protein [Paracoccaceae bacterium]
MSKPSKTRGSRLIWSRALQLRRQKRFSTVVNVGLVLLGPILVLGTYLVLGPLEQNARSNVIRLVVMADIIYVLVTVAMVSQRILRIISQRRQKSAGSRLHLRLTGVFTVMALLPTITVAVFALLSINMGLEAWFSDRVKGVIEDSLAAAQAYEEDQKASMSEDTASLVQILEQYRRTQVRFDPQALRETLSQEQQGIQRGLREAFIINGQGELILRGHRSYLFDYEKPDPSKIDASLQAVVLIEDWQNNELRALAYLSGFPDYYLLVSRQVDGNLLALLDETQATAKLYQQLEQDASKQLFEFALLYLAFAILLIVSSIWLALLFAERLSRPIGRLAGAAQRVGEGKFDTRVIEEDGEDELSLLSKYFNKMTGQLKVQRDALVENTNQIERRRRLFDSVLSSVTSGVVGLDPEGRVSFVNPSAQRLLSWKNEQQLTDLSVAVPEFFPLFERLRDAPLDSIQEEVKVVRAGRLENLLVRMAPRRQEDQSLEGYVVAFDDITDLVSAQRSAAWGDVARRIAHEIKNPLTPIQLSAERIRRKFIAKLDGDEQAVEQMTDVIIRQTNDLRRIVDEFSKFARMPEPEKRSEDIAELLRSAVVLQEAGQPDVGFDMDIPGTPVLTEIDATMMSQAFTNLLKNAGEAIEARQEKRQDASVPGKIIVKMTPSALQLCITVADNGTGLPTDRSRLFEPYVTTRDKGTGLGLAIVRKIIEEHGGSLRLEDADPFDGADFKGAKAVILLPTQALQGATEMTKEAHK